MAKMTKAQQAQMAAAREELRALLSPGDVVGVIQRHVSRSGMMRHLSLYFGDRNITWLAGQAMGERVHDLNGYHVLKVSGCGMDMHFATVYNLSRTLFPSPDSDGGYILTHRTL